MTTKPKNNNIERARTRAREEIENSVLRLREAADDARIYLSEEGILAGQMFLLERAARTAKSATTALNWALEQLSQQRLEDFLERGVSE